MSALTDLAQPTRKTRRTVVVKTTPGAKPQYETDTFSQPRVSSETYAPATTETDVKRAHRHDRKERKLSPAQVREMAAKAVRTAFPDLSPDERDDLTQETAIKCARYRGWEPQASRVSVEYLQLIAASNRRDLKRWQDVQDSRSERLDARQDADLGDDSPAPENRHDALQTWLGDNAKPTDATYGEIAAALGCPATSPAADAVMAAISGYGSAVDLAAARGYSVSYAENRLSRGRKWLRERYPTAGQLVDALAQVGDLARLRESVPADGRSTFVMAAQLRGKRDVRCGVYLRRRPTDPTPVQVVTLAVPEPTRPARKPHVAGLETDWRTDDHADDRAPDRTCRVSVPVGRPHAVTLRNGRAVAAYLKRCERLQ